MLLFFCQTGPKVKVGETPPCSLQAIFLLFEAIVDKEIGSIPWQPCFQITVDQNVWPSAAVIGVLRVTKCLTLS